MVLMVLAILIALSVIWGTYFRRHLLDDGGRRCRLASYQEAADLGPPTITSDRSEFSKLSWRLFRAPLRPLLRKLLARSTELGGEIFKLG
jgi:hypothetical protein